MTPIIGTTTRSVAALNRWLASKGCPEFAGLYATAARSYGVRWDLAIFQSCLETGFWRFGGDVKVTQNNFAGIGAKGGGVPGDSFPSPLAGIEAQIQNLALRAGVEIPKDQIISPYVKDNYDFIKARNTKNWEDLAGTWAADRGYWEKIADIAGEFDTWSKSQAPAEPLEGSVTWFEMNRTPEGDTVCVAYAGEAAKALLKTNDKAVLADFLGRFSNARNVLVAPAGKSVPGVPEYNRGGAPTEPEEEEPTPRPSAGEPGQKRPWIKWASDIGAIATRREYRYGFPEGAVVHHTAGRTLAGDHQALKDGPYPCLIIDKDGTVYQPMPLNKWGCHSGTWHHEYYVGIEVSAAGKLSKTPDGYRSWFGQIYKPADVRVVQGSRIPIPGAYHKFTDAQEASLIQLLLYLKNEAPDIFSFDRVIGHDEACDAAGQFGRKNDPGGSLSMTMPELRALLKREYEAMIS